MSITQSRLLSLLESAESALRAFGTLRSAIRAGLPIPDLTGILNTATISLAESSAESIILSERQAYNLTVRRNERTRAKRHAKRGALEGPSHYAAPAPDATGTPQVHHGAPGTAKSWLASSQALAAGLPAPALVPIAFPPPDYVIGSGLSPEIRAELEALAEQTVRESEFLATSHQPVPHEPPLPTDPDSDLADWLNSPEDPPEDPPEDF